MYALIRRKDIELTPALPDHSHGLTRALLIGAHTGSTHTGLMLVELAGGHVDTHLHSFESSFYVLSGEPVLYLDGHGVELRPGACGAIPVGVAHAWRAAGASTWIEMASPRPRTPGTQPSDTFFLGPAPNDTPLPLDLRDPRNRNLFLLGEDDMDLDRLREGAKVTAPTVSASMATAALAYSGITVKMLVDKRLDAQLHTMFMVDYRPGGTALPHDHPFEESYYMLGGEIDVVADGERHTLHTGDAFWTGVGCIHAFYELKDGTAMWLETSAPGPPDRHAYRFDRDWDYLADQLD